MAATWIPNLMFQIGADYRRTAPDLFLPLNSIFRCFRKRHAMKSAECLFKPIRRLRFYGDLAQS